MKLGFEIEIENTPGLGNDVPLVQRTSDGSLRNGVEYVTDPLPDIEYALNLYSYLYNNLQGEYTERCGFHFHMDFTNYTPQSILNFVSRYITIERTLFRLYPEIFRANNNFCNLLIDSQAELTLIRKFITGSSPHTDWEPYSKYTALNLKPLSRQSTIEFRAIYAGLSPDNIHKVFSIFNQLYNFDEDIPLLSEVTTADLMEANSIIQLLNTPLESSSSVGDYMEYHFNVPTQTLSREAIINYIRGIS